MPIPLSDDDHAELSSLYAKLEPPVMRSASALWAGRWGQRAQRLSAINQRLAFDTIHRCHEAGDSPRQIRREVIRQFRLRERTDGYGVSPLLVLSLISVAVQLYRLYLEWRNNR